MKQFKKYLPYLPLIALLIVMICVWFFVIKSNNKSDYLKVVFLDVGQGDAIYVEAPNGKQILIDAGPDAKILSSLSKVMPFADRSIDMIVATHADLDHIGGFSLLLDNYKVTSILENGATSDTKAFTSLEEKISRNKVNKIIAHRGMHIILDDKKNIYFDILFPDRDVGKLDSNEGSIVGKIVYGDNSFLLTGDASIYTENLIEWNEKKGSLKADVLKLGHHGSKTSSGVLWLEEVNPKIAIISAGKNNRYGHPHKELLDRLKNLQIPFLSTALLGNIVFKSDGVNLIY